MIHLICGPIGAGKTTLARNIAEENGAIRFSEDEWLKTLFVPDAPDGLLSESPEAVASWAIEKYERCREKIWLVCDQLLNQGVSVVLDGAAANFDQRNFIRQRAKHHNVAFKLHYITADRDVRKERVMNRNKDQGDTYSLEVTEGMFNMMESFFEAPNKKELEGANKIAF